MSNYDTKSIPPPAATASLALGFHNWSQVKWLLHKAFVLFSWTWMPSTTQVGSKSIMTRATDVYVGDVIVSSYLRFLLMLPHSNDSSAWAFGPSLYSFLIKRWLLSGVTLLLWLPACGILPALFSLVCQCGRTENAKEKKKKSERFKLTLQSPDSRVDGLWCKRREAFSFDLTSRSDENPSSFLLVTSFPKISSNLIQLGTCDKLFLHQLLL